MKGIAGGLYVCAIFFIIYLIKHTGAACTFPDLIRGNWISSEKGTLNFTNNTLWNYPISLTAEVTSATFTCESIYNGFYFLKGSTSFNLFNVDFYPYLCVELTQISATKYIYNIQCDSEIFLRHLSNGRFKSCGDLTAYCCITSMVGNCKINAIVTSLLVPARVFVRATTTSVNASTACNRESPTDKSDFSVLVKEGAVSSLQATATCPTDFLATFSNFTVTGYTGANQCTGNSLDVCTDRTAMNYTYNSCSSSVKFSSGGYFYCLYYQTNSSTGVTYLHVYNKDNTVVSGSTYRIVCYAFKTSGNILYTTEYPGSCHSNQNATYVKSPGLIANYFNTTNTCVIVVKSNIQDWKYIAAIVGGLAGLVVLIIVLVVVIKKRLLCRCCSFMCQKCHKERKVTQSQENIEEPMRTKFVAKKPRKIKNVILIAEATKQVLETPFMPELLYTVEPKRLTSPRKMFYQTPTFKSEKSLGKIELEPQNQKEKS